MLPPCRKRELSSVSFFSDAMDGGHHSFSVSSSFSFLLYFDKDLIMQISLYKTVLELGVKGLGLGLGCI